MTWSPSANRDQNTLRMNAGSFLGWGGPQTNPRHPTDRATGPYTGYTADNAGNLRTHAVTADDGEMDLRTIVQIEQMVDTITTSPELATAGTYMVAPTTAHSRAATVDEQSRGIPGSQSFLPSFDDLTGPGVFNPTTTTSAAPRRLLTDADIHNGISNAGSRVGGSNYSKFPANVDLDADNTADTGAAITGATVSTWYNTAGVTPSNQPPVEPMGLDIVTDTRAVNVATGEVVDESNQLAVRYRFIRGTDANADGIMDVPANTDSDGDGTVETGLDANRDGFDDGDNDVPVTYIYNTGRCARSTATGWCWRSTGVPSTLVPAASPAYQDGVVTEMVAGTGTSNTARTLDQSVWSATGVWTAGTLPIEVDVTDDGDSDGDQTVDAGSLSYAKYGFWSYNNTRGCTTCPTKVDLRAGGLRGATALWCGRCTRECEHPEPRGSVERQDGGILGSEGFQRFDCPQYDGEQYRTRYRRCRFQHRPGPGEYGDSLQRYQRRPRDLQVPGYVGL